MHGNTTSLSKRPSRAKRIAVGAFIVLATYILILSSAAFALTTVNPTVNPSSTAANSGVQGSATISAGNAAQPSNITVAFGSNLPFLWGFLYYNQATVTVEFGVGNAPGNGQAYNVALIVKDSNGNIISTGQGSFTGDGNTTTFNVNIPLDVWITAWSLSGATVEVYVVPS